MDVNRDSACSDPTALEAKWLFFAPKNSIRTLHSYNSTEALVDIKLAINYVLRFVGLTA